MKSQGFFLIFKKIYLFYLFLAVLGLRCWARAFSSCGERGLLFIAVRGLLITVASRCGAWALGVWASVVVPRGLSGSAACGIFLDQGSNPCPLHWQAHSQPLHHPGSPERHFLIFFFFFFTMHEGLSVLSFDFVNYTPLDISGG